MSAVAELLQPLAPWLADTHVSEIMINRPGEIWIEYEGHLQAFSLPVLTRVYLLRLFQLIANENHQVISRQRPLLSGNLPDGSRVQLCLPPVSQHPVCAIRRQTVQHFQLADYAAQGFYQQNVACSETHTVPTEDLLHTYYVQEDWPAFIQTAIRLRKNIVISGGTSSGKTTFLNACLYEMEPQDRLLVLEDAREVKVPHDNHVCLLASKVDQGEAQVDMQMLVQCCLRLRPDRILMGEMRGAEIMYFVHACSTGHEGALASVHANTPKMAFMRMVQMYKLNAVPTMTDQDILSLLEAVIDVILQVVKTPRGRRLHSVYYRGV